MTKSGVDTDPEGVVSDDVGVGKRTNHAVWKVCVGRLAQQVAAEKQACSNAMILNVLHQI